MIRLLLITILQVLLAVTLLVSIVTGALDLSNLPTIP